MASAALVAQPGTQLATSTQESRAAQLSQLVRRFEGLRSEQFDSISGRDLSTITPEECRELIDIIASDCEPCGLEIANKAIDKILRMCPHKRDIEDPDAYQAGLAVILSDFPVGVANYISDARTGIIRHVKWVPLPKEILDFCEARMSVRHRLIWTANKLIQQWQKREDEAKRKSSAQVLDKSRAESAKALLSNAVRRA
jgi:hypothetical protein